MKYRRAVGILKAGCGRAVPRQHFVDAARLRETVVSAIGGEKQICVGAPFAWSVQLGLSPLDHCLGVLAL